MYKVLSVILFCIISLSLTVGCSTIGGYTLTKRDTIEKQILAARSETEAKMTGLKVQEDKLLHDTIDQHVAREQAAADYLFKGFAVYGGLKSADINRPTRIMGQSIQQTASQLPAATPEAQATTFKALQVELDEVKTTTEALKLQYEAELGVARQEGEVKAKALVELKSKVEQIEASRVEVLTKARATEQDLQAEKDKIQDKDLAVARHSEEQAKSMQAIKTKLSSIIGGLSLLCIIGAIWSPVFKEKFGIGAAVFGIAAVSIWYIEGWMVATIVAIVILALIGWAVKNHYIESKTATNVYRAIQSFKDTAKDDYEKLLKPQLEEWMTVYDKKTGEKIVDKAAVNHIEAKLMEVGDK